MKNISNENTRREIINRISTVTGNEAAQWGKMNIHQMIVHCSDQLRMSMGLKETEYIDKPLLGVVMKRLVLMGLPIPKGKVETTKELKQGEGGTAPIELETDKVTLIKLIEDFDKSFDFIKTRKHPFFGEMNFNQWAKLVYIHTNYHLSQFSR